VLIWLTGDTLIPNPIDQNPWAHWRSHERLDLQGNPIHDVPKRLMVQGRQLYATSTVMRVYSDGIQTRSVWRIAAWNIW
jgi:hypothetical protein